MYGAANDTRWNALKIISQRFSHWIVRGAAIFVFYWGSDLQSHLAAITERQSLQAKLYRQTLSWMINLPAIFRVHEMSKSLNASHRRLQHRRLFIPNSNHKLSITNDEHEKSPLAFQSYVDPAAFCCPSTLHHPLYSNFSSRRRKGVTITMITNNSVLLRAGLCSRDSSRSSKRSYHK